MRGAYATILTSLMLGATACGEEPTEAAKAADAYNALVEAVGDDDYEKACERLTEKTRRDLLKAGQIQETGDCAKTLERVVADVGTDKSALAAVTASDVKIDAPTSARVGDVRLAKSGDEWGVEGDLDFVRPFLSGAEPPQS